MWYALRPIMVTFKRHAQGSRKTFWYGHLQNRKSIFAPNSLKQTILQNILENVAW